MIVKISQLSFHVCVCIPFVRKSLHYLVRVSPFFCILILWWGYQPECSNARIFIQHSCTISLVVIRYDQSKYSSSWTFVLPSSNSLVHWSIGVISLTYLALNTCCRHLSSYQKQITNHTSQSAGNSILKHSDFSVWSMCFASVAVNAPTVMHGMLGICTNTFYKALERNSEINKAHIIK